MSGFRAAVRMSGHLCRDVSLAERVITIEDGKGGKRREVPIRPELAKLLRLHIGRRRAGPLFMSRQTSKSSRSRVYTRQRVGQMVRGVAIAAGITKRIYPHLLRHTVATRLLALGMAITDVQRFLGHDDISTTRIYAESSVAMLRRKFDQVTAPGGRALVQEHRRGARRGRRRLRLGPLASATAASSSVPLVHEPTVLVLA